MFSAGHQLNSYCVLSITVVYNECRRPEFVFGAIAQKSLSPSGVHERSQETNKIPLYIILPDMIPRTKSPLS